MNSEETVVRLVNALGLAIEHIEVLKNQIIHLENDIVILEDRVTTLLTTPQQPVECDHKFVTIEWGQLRSVEKCSKCGKMQYGRGNY